MIFSKKKYPQKGMTLLETSIALGVVILIISSLWMSANAVRHKANLTQAAQNVLEIATLVRNAYTGLPSASPSAVQAQQIAKGLFPPHILNTAGTATVNAWGGDYNLAFVFVAGFVRGVAVGLSFPLTLNAGLSKEICVNLASQIQPHGVNAGTFPALSAAPPSFNEAQGSSPSNTFINSQDVTGFTPIAMLGAAGGQCLSIQFYFPF